MASKKSNSSSSLLLIIYSLTVVLSLLVFVTESAPRQAFRRDPGHSQWHHGAFHDVRDSVRSDVRRMLHTRAEVIFLSFSILNFSLNLVFAWQSMNLSEERATN